MKNMFGPYLKGKALCGCGALADLDLGVVYLKKGLGKRVECRSCRNRRVAQEKDALDRDFFGIEEQDLDW